MSYPTTTFHPKRYPYTSIMASPYNADPLGAIDCAPAIESLKADQSNGGRIHFPSGSYTIGTNLTIPTGMVVTTEPGTVISVTAGRTLTNNGTFEIDRGSYIALANGATYNGYGVINAGADQKVFTWTGTGNPDLTNCPNREIPLTWFGAQSGTSNDCYSALTKMNTSIARHQSIYFPHGVWRCASPWVPSVSSENGYGLKGDGPFSSFFYIDLPSGVGDGVTFTPSAGNADCFGFRVRDMAFVGPANCCVNGVVIDKAHLVKFDTVAFYMGATAYAWKIYGSIYGEGNFINIGQAGDIYDSLGFTRPKSGVGFISRPDGYGNNVWDLDLVISAMGQTGPSTYTGDGVYIENAQSLTIRGSLEACGYPLRVLVDNTDSKQQAQDIRIATEYAYDLNTNGFHIEGGNKITIDTCGVQVGGSAVAGSGTVIKNSKSICIRNSRFDSLTIGADCQDTELDGVGVSNTNGFVNLAADTRFTGPVYSLSTPYNPFPSPGPDRRNLITTGFSRWPASGPPDGWGEGDGTWTKETSVVHGTTNSAKVNTNGHTLYPTYTLNADQLKQVLGQYINFSMWIKVPAGTFSTYPAVYIFPTVPTRVDSTAYSIGDCVQPTVTNGFMYKVISGTGDFKTDAAPPTYPTTEYRTVVDHNVTLMCLAIGNSSYSTTPILVADAGKWKQFSVGHYTPFNATGCQLAVYLYRTTAPADVDYYLSEPCLIKGGLGPKGVIPGYGEFQSPIHVGANNVYFGTAPPAVANTWYAQGDICFNSAIAAAGIPGWSCITGGVAGAAVWQKWAVTAALP